MALNNRKTALSPDEIEAAAALLLELVPVFLRFLDDEYDDTSMLVHPLLNDILNTVRVIGYEFLYTLFNGPYSIKRQSNPLQIHT
jgi:hypothetical protein